MNAQQLQTDIETLLGANHVMHLATDAGDGGVHAASLFFALDGLSLLWTSDPAARHSQHLEANRQVAATVAPDCSDFRDVRGLQIAGVACRLRSAAEVERASLAMRLRYPFLEQLASGPPELSQAFAQAGFYRLDPAQITLIDNARGFGHKQTLQVHADGTLACADG